MATAMIAMKFKKRPKPEIEGPPEREESMGAGRDEELEPGAEHEDGGPASDEMEAAGGHDEHAEMALDELADIVGVSPEDRQDFGHAMTALMHATIAKVMAEQDEEPGPGEGEEEPEEEPEPEEE
jgi:hypothetical protein